MRFLEGKSRRANDSGSKMDRDKPDKDGDHHNERSGGNRVDEKGRTDGGKANEID
jgi:hypothetical protein